MVRIGFRWWMVWLMVITALLGTIGESDAADPNGEFPIRRVSIGNAEEQANDESALAFVSNGGEYVAFNSDADNLVANDNNGVSDVFLRNTTTGTTTRISVANTGGDADNYSDVFGISGDGQHILFNSMATNLIGGDTNGAYDGFIYDRVANTIARVTLRNNGGQGNGDSSVATMSANGRYVGFLSNATNIVPNDTNGVRDCFIRDLQNGTTQRVTLTAVPNPNGDCNWIDLSSTGRYVAFESEADNLMLGDTNGESDVFVLDRQTDTLERVSVRSNGNQANGASGIATISNDGRFVAFLSTASNLVQGDTNGSMDVFVHDRDTAETTVASVSSTGGLGSADSHLPFISENGQRIVFYSEATNLVPDDTNAHSDAFVHDLITKETTRISVGRTLQEGNNSTTYTTIAPDGSAAALVSEASNLVPSDTNGVQDAFKVDLAPNNLPTPTASATASPSATATRTGTAVPPTATRTPSVTPTGTFIPPTLTATPSVTATPTGTFVPPTATIPPSSTPTGTIVPPTTTSTPSVTPTGTLIPPTLTTTPSVTPNATATPTPSLHRLYLSITRR